MPPGEARSSRAGAVVEILYSSLYVRITRRGWRHPPTQQGRGLPWADPRWVGFCYSGAFGRLAGPVGKWTTTVVQAIAADRTSRRGCRGRMITQGHDEG